MLNRTTSYFSSRFANLLLNLLGIHSVQFEISLIFTHVSDGDTIQVPGRLQLAHSIHNRHPIDFNLCHHHLNGHCHCLCQCSTLQRCSAWTMPHYVSHLIAFGAFLSIIAIGAATSIFLILETTTGDLTATIARLLDYSSLLWILLFIVLLQLWEHYCHLQLVFIL